MGLGTKILVGALVAGAVGVGAAVVLERGSADTSSPGVRWAGTVGTRRWQVRRNGDSWAWQGEGVGSGAESGWRESLRAVLEALAQSPGDVTAIALQGAVEIARGEVDAAGDGWRWSVQTAQEGTIASAVAAKRGAAILAMLGALGNLDVEEIGPDDDTVPIPPDELPKPPKLPPVPPPDPQDPPVGVQQPGAPNAGGWAPENLVEITSAEDLEAWSVAETLDPTGAVLPRSSVVLLAHDRAWAGRDASLSELWQLATDFPDVTFVHVDFALTRRVFGQPDFVLGYVASAVGPDGRPRVNQLHGQSLNAFAVSPSRWAQLVGYARLGPGPSDPVLFRDVGSDGRTYAVMVVRRGGAWEWLAWRGAPEDEAAAAGRGGAPTRQTATALAQSWLASRPAVGGSQVPGLAVAGA